MANEEKRNPATAEETDISKSQSAQQPPAQAGQPQPFAEDRQEETGEQAAGQPDEGQQGETLAQQRTDIEGATLNKPERADEESGFIGTEGETDTSSKLVADKDEDEEFTPEGK